MITCGISVAEEDMNQDNSRVCLGIRIMPFMEGLRLADFEGIQLASTRLNSAGASKIR